MTVSEQRRRMGSPPSPFRWRVKRWRQRTTFLPVAHWLRHHWWRMGCLLVRSWKLLTVGSPARVSGSSTLLSPSQGITAIFVGSICVRKGVHLLLRYWAESGVQGRLVLLGEIEPAIKDKCADLLKRNDVVILPWVREGELGALYRSADVFLLPTFEEGSPLVIYEACGCGLPVITTPMGAGSIVRHNCEGLVIDPYDSGGWIMAICTLAGNVELRRKMGNAAAERAQSFVWKAVAARRREQILSSITAATTRSSVS